MCSEYKDAIFPSLLRRKRKSSHEWFLYYVDVIKIGIYWIKFIISSWFGLVSSLFNGATRKCKITSVGTVLCLCWPVLEESMLHGGEGVGVARFLGDLPGLSRCGEVQSGFYFSPFFSLLPKRHAHWFVGWCWALPRGRFEATGVQGPAPSSPSCTKEGLLSLVQGPPHLPSILQGHWQHS